MKKIFFFLFLCIISTTIFAKNCPDEHNGLTFHLASAIVDPPSHTVTCTYLNNTTGETKTINMTSSNLSNSFGQPWHIEDKNIYCDKSSTDCSF